MGEDLPDGFDTIEDGWRAVVRHDLERDIRAALAAGTLYEFARSYPGARVFRGRAAAYAIELKTSGVAVVVRRSAHGGLLAPFTGELFLHPGRAPHELAVSRQLRERGVCTPELLGYVVYPVGPFCKVDVFTAFIAGSVDLAGLLHESRDEHTRTNALRATRALLAALARAKAAHPDLNMRNVLIERSGGAVSAWVLDVDRVHLDSPPGSAAANLRRLLRSARKLRRHEGLEVSEAELALLSAPEPAE